MLPSAEIITQHPKETGMGKDACRETVCVCVCVCERDIFLTDNEDRE